MKPSKLSSFLARIMVATLLASAAPASAAIRTVTNLNDSGAGSLRGTIAAASSGDTIRFALTGTIVLTSGTLILNKNLTIEGPGGPAVLVITRNTAEGAARFRLMEANSKTVSLTGLTLTGGYATEDGGGAYHNLYGSLTARNCVFSNNTVRAGNSSNPAPDVGGAILNMTIEGSPENTALTVVLEDCVFSGNSCSQSGGAVANAFRSGGPGNGVGSITATVNRCTFTGNSATGSGGGLLHGARGGLTVTSCTFQNNTASLFGGGLSSNGLSGGPPLIIEGSTFANNSAELESGGALYFNAGTVRKCLFTQNQARDGGALRSGGTATVEACTFHGNEARGSALVNGAKGGAILHTVSNGLLTVTGCTLTDNRALSGAHGIHNGSAATPVLIRNTLIYGNAAFTQPHLGGEGAFTSEGYNLSGDAGGGYLTAAGDQINTDAKLDPLGPQDHGGPTKTIALLSNSPALDRGRAFGLTMDQRGVQRPIGLTAYPNAPGGDGSDIGAFESIDPLASPLVVTTLHDHDDGVASETDCTLREAIKRANALMGVNSISFHPSVQGTIALDRALGALAITSSAQINGPGARVLAVNALGYMRVFEVGGSAAAALISGLSIRGGSAGGVPATAGMGGGIYNGGRLTFTDCVFDDHYVRGGTATTLGGHGSDGYGGGIYNAGNLTLNRCTFTSCLAAGGFGNNDPTPGGVGIPPGRGGNGGHGCGGAVYHAGLSLTVNQCTFSASNASGAAGGQGGRFGGAGGSGQGGAIFYNGGTMLITGSTMTGNYSLGGSGGLGSTSAFDGAPGVGGGGVTTAPGGTGTVTLRSTVIAGNLRNGNLPADVSGTFISQGYNFIGSVGMATGLTQATDQKGTNAAPLDTLLGPLQNNGGSTNTLVPLTGSPLIDKGKSFGLTTDQTGLPRPLDAPNLPNATGGDGSDIGSVEADVALPGPVFTVNSLDDHDDGSASYRDCTLREAINAANFAAAPNTVFIQQGLEGAITLSPVLETPTIVGSLTLVGPGARHLTVQRSSPGHVLVFSAGPHHVSGLTLSGGNNYGGSGGSFIRGGGIFNAATLTLSDCTISNNSALGGDSSLTPGRQPGGAAYGGGVANFGKGNLTLERCTFANNRAIGGHGSNNPGQLFSGVGGEGNGGAVFNDAGCTLTVINSTFHGNVATGGNAGAATLGASGGDAQGAVCNFGTMTMTACTVSSNSGQGGQSGPTYGVRRGTGGISAGGGTSMLRNTLCAGNSGSGLDYARDIFGTFTSQGFNLIGQIDGAGGFTAQGDQTGTFNFPINPQLGPLQNNGGPTDTLAPQFTSAAFDRGKNFALTTDQRGAARTHDHLFFTNAAGGDATDIGAYESRPAYTGPPDFVKFTRAGAAMLIRLQGEPALTINSSSAAI